MVGETLGRTGVGRRVSARLGIAGLTIGGLLWAGTIDAQTVFDQNGFGEHRGTYSVLPYEHVDPLSGNLLLVVTDLALPGNAGLGVSVQRVYNSAVYPDYESNSLALEEDSWAGIGWRLHFGRVLHEESTAGGGTEIEMGDGSRHPLFHTTARPEGWITKDFWVYDKNTHTLKLPNGIIYTFGRQVFLNPRLGTVRYITEIRDPFNNTITFSYFPPGGPPDGVAQIRQVLASDQVREINFDYDPTLKSLRSMTFDGRTWTYGQQAFGPAGYSALTSVTPPAGKPWTYTYESAPGYVGLTSMLVPGGGVVSYTYSDATRYAGSVTKRARVVTARSISGHQITPGTWTFIYSDGPNKDQTVVACPCGITRYRYLGIGLSGTFNAWNTGALAERTLESGNGTVMERETLTWQASEPVSPDPIPASDGLWGDPAVYNALLVSRVVTRSSQSWTTSFEYRSGLGNYNDYTRPWRTTESGELTRITTRTFQYGFTPYVVDRVATEDVKVGPEIVTSSWTYNLTTGFLQQHRPLGVLTTFEPLANGNVDAIVDANNNRTTFQYRWGVVSRIATPLLTTTREIEPSGLVLSETVGALTTRYEYDLAFRPKKVIPAGGPPAPNVITYEYDGLHQEWIRIARDQSQVSQQLDGFGRVIGTSDRLNIKTRTTRDACGRVTFQSAPYTTGDGSRGVQTQYDALNRVTSTKAVPDNSTTTYTYGTTYYQMWDAESRRTRYDFQAFGHPSDARLSGVTLGVSTPLAQTTRYTYDVLGNLTQVTSPGGVPARTWTYDSRGLPLTDRQPESGLTTYEHDAAGRLTKVTDAKGQITILGYDANNRLLTRNATGTDADITYGYDSYGRLSTVTTESTVTTYGYDNAGRISSRTDVVAGRTFVSGYAYDLNDNLTTITYPAYPTGRRQVTYAYDIENRLTAVRQNGALFAHTFTYDDSGRLGSYVTGAVTHATTYDTRDRVQRLTAGPTGAAALDLTYGYNRVSHVQSLADTRPGMSQTFTYDELDRLKTASGPYGTISWDYDAAGNRLFESRGTTTTYQYDVATQRLTSTGGAAPESFTYDNIGQLTSDSRGTYAYAANGLLRTATAPNVAATYTYDGDDLRVRRTVNGRTIYTIRSVGGQVLAEYEEQCGTFYWTRDLVHAGGRLLGAVRSTAGTATPAQATVTLEHASVTLGEHVGSHAPRLRLTTANGAALTCAVSVSFETRDGTATAGATSDYLSRTGTITFPVGTVSGSFIALSPGIVINDDASDEPDQSFTFVLTNGGGATLGTPSTQTITLTDNDQPPALTVNDVVVNETAGSVTFRLSLSAPSAFPISVNFSTQDDSARTGWDYTGVSGIATFDPSMQWRDVSVPVLDDLSAEDAESFRLVLSNASNAALVDPVGYALILDNEPPRAPINSTLTGNYFADGTALAGDKDFLVIGNRHATPVTARLTFTRPNGSGSSRDVVVPATRRITVDVSADASVAGGEFSFVVQTTDNTRPLDAEHSAYGPNRQAGRSTEGVMPSPQWYFAEGSVGYFDEFITVFNPTNGPVDVTFTLLGPSGLLLTRTEHIEEGPGRKKFAIRDWIGGGDHGTQIVARDLAGGLAPVVVERTMTWQADRRESHSSPGVATPALTWYFAEGDTGFATYHLIANPVAAAQSVRVDYLHENGTVYQETVGVPALGRITVPVPSWLPLGSFGVRLTSLTGSAIVAERVMYGGTDWTLGHAGIGVTAPATTWTFTEGSTGADWDTYLLITNPSAATATVYFTFTTEGGAQISHGATVPANSRRSVLVDAFAGMSAALFRTAVTSTQPIVIERVTYWPGGSQPLSLTTAGGGPTGTADTPGQLAAGPNADVDANAGGDANATPAMGLTPYGARRHPKPPNFYSTVTPGEPAGLIEQALAAELEAQQPQPIDDATGAARTGTASITASGPWYGSHGTSGRRP